MFTEKNNFFQRWLGYSDPKTLVQLLSDWEWSKQFRKKLKYLLDIAVDDLTKGLTYEAGILS